MYSFKKHERLCEKRFIDELFQNGISFYEYPFRVFYKFIEFDSIDNAKILISVSKRNIKNAVSRNLIKRRIREAYRLNKFFFLENLKLHNKKLAFAVIYTAKTPLDYKLIVEKIVLILQSIIKRNEKAN